MEDLIREEITREGPMTFARFMALALYHPTLGYYSGGGAGREPLGWGGDYFTSGDLHPLWGWSLARQIHQIWELLGRPPRFDVAEPGAGRGLLAREIWRYARERAPDWSAALRYTLVDRAAPDSPLRAKREARLASELHALDVPPGATCWVRSLDEAFGPRGLTGVVVSNELVDALPVHVLQVRQGRLWELYVALRDGRLIPGLDDPSTPELEAYLDRYRIPWRDYPEGWQCEVCLLAPPWMESVGHVIGRGFVLTIDYGDTARRLYTRDRYRGTLAAYARHQLGDDPLAQPGRQDLTAHVNFTALVEAGRSQGLRLARMITQREFLLNLGIRDEAEALGRTLYPAADTERSTDRGQADHLRRMTLRNAVAALTDPRGLGSFQVLIQQRGVPGAARQLLGLRSEPG